MSIDYASFRIKFPQFSDETKYPDATLDIFYSMAQDFIDSNPNQCAVLSGNKLALALQYLTAHLLYIASEQSQSAISGEAEQGGFITSATIGDISVSKLAPPANDGWEFWLSGSPYGIALWGLLQLLSVGGLSLGGLPEREGFRKIGGVFW